MLRHVKNAIETNAMKSWLGRVLLGGMAVSWLLSNTALADLRVRDLCRIKGQEQNTLQGMGLVVGLKGTGDGDSPTLRSLARTMQLMGTPLPKSPTGQELVSELKNAKNVAMVFVTATAPGEGAREGSVLDCQVNAISAKSLEGGYLLPTPLLGPHPGNPRVYGFAQGMLTSSASGPPTSLRAFGACRLETDITTEFVREDRITLVIDRAHASFQTAQDLEDLLNSERDFVEGTSGQGIARAQDSSNVEIQIPEKYRANPVQFASYVLNLRLPPPRADARVVIRERDGVIVVGEGVGIGPLAVTHKSLTIQTNGQPAVGPFIPVDTSADSSVTRLQSLVNALNALKVPTADVIDIIKGLERSGGLYGKVIIE